MLVINKHVNFLIKYIADKTDEVKAKVFYQMVMLGYGMEEINNYFRRLDKDPNKLIPRSLNMLELGNSICYSLANGNVDMSLYLLRYFKKYMHRDTIWSAIEGQNLLLLENVLLACRKVKPFKTDVLMMTIGGKNVYCIKYNQWPRYRSTATLYEEKSIPKINKEQLQILFKYNIIISFEDYLLQIGLGNKEVMELFSTTPYFELYSTSTYRDQYQHGNIEKIRDLTIEELRDWNSESKSTLDYTTIMPNINKKIYEEMKTILNMNDDDINDKADRYGVKRCIYAYPLIKDAPTKQLTGRNKIDQKFIDEVKKFMGPPIVRTTRKEMINFTHSLAIGVRWLEINLNIKTSEATLKKWLIK